MTDGHSDITWLTRPDGLRLATRRDPGRPGCGPGILFVHGLMSNMDGAKAQALSSRARGRGWAFQRMDLSGHGRSDGAFAECSVSRWRDDALLALDHFDSSPDASRQEVPDWGVPGRGVPGRGVPGRRVPGRVILAGSSLGGWIALLAALARPERVAGLLLIAPAPDMTRRVAAHLTEAARLDLARHGVWLRPSSYGPPIPITRRMLDDGEALCLLDQPVAISCPVRILHGQQDPDVPWQGSLLLAERLQSLDVQTTLLKHGDHRLSQPRELAVLLQILDALHQAAFGSCS